VYDVTVVGAGIVGLATARALLMRHPRLRLAVLEKEPRPALHQSSHNSGVIHTGIYYTPGSLKARLCMDGRRALLEYCDAKGIPYRLPGKMIVAVCDRELPRLQALFERGTANGIAGLEMLDASGIREREPHCAGLRAIVSAGTGIVNFGQVAVSLAADVQELNGAVLTGHAVTAIAQRSHGLDITTKAGGISTRALVACAGLDADRVARMAGGKRDPKIVPFRGNYLVLKPERRHLVRTNVYPVPDPSLPFLGAHFTPRMDGAVWLGPNAILAPGDLMKSLTYSGLARLAVNYWRVAAVESYRDVFTAAYVRFLRRYIPELRHSDVLRGPSGVRAQALDPDGTLVDDFVFEETSRALHVRNAPSPAATASLAIGEYIAARASECFGW
jgi:L-2-hydroxyglutarate oxidase LhgO